MIASIDDANWKSLLSEVAREFPRGAGDTALKGIAPSSPEAIAAGLGLILVAVPAGHDVPRDVPVIGISPLGRPERMRAGASAAADTRRWAVAPLFGSGDGPALAAWAARRGAIALAPAMVVAAVASAIGLAGMRLVLDGHGVAVALVIAAALAIGWAWQMAVHASAVSGEAMGWHLRTATLWRMLRTPGTVASPEVDPTVLGSVDVLVATAIRHLGPVVSLAIAATVPSAIFAALSWWPAACLVLVVPVACISGLWLAAPRIVTPAADAIAHAARGREVLASRLADPGSASRAEVETAAVATIAANARSRRAMLPLIAMAVVLPLAVATASTFGRASGADLGIAAITILVVAALWATVLQESGRALATLAPLAMFRTLFQEPADTAASAVEINGLERAFGKVVEHGRPVTIRIDASTVAGPEAMRLPEGGARVQAWIPAERTLPSGTLGSIITGPADASPGDRERIATLVGLDRFLGYLPLGWATPVFDQAPWIDHSTRFRILLARALLKEPAMLVVDRALDDLAQAERRALAGLLGSLTCTVVLLTERMDLVIPDSEVKYSGDLSNAVQECRGEAVVANA